MTKVADNAHFWGDADSGVFFAPLGSTLPTTLTDPTTPFEEIGWLSEDGIDLEVSTDVKKVKGYQGGATVRTRVTGTEKGFKIQCLEDTPLVAELFWGATAPTVTTGVAKVDLPDGMPTVARAAVIKLHDGTSTRFYCLERVEATDRGTVSHKNTDETVYEISFEIIGDAYILTNEAAFVAAP